MKKNTTSNSFVLFLRLLSAHLREWMHQLIEKKGEHLDNCAWYPGPRQFQLPPY